MRLRPLPFVVTGLILVIAATYLSIGASAAVCEEVSARAAYSEAARGFGTTIGAAIQASDEQASQTDSLELAPVYGVYAGTIEGARTIRAAADTPDPVKCLPSLPLP